MVVVVVVVGGGARYASGRGAAAVRGVVRVRVWWVGGWVGWGGVGGVGGGARAVYSSTESVMKMIS